jgi:hypothetical protein
LIATAPLWEPPGGRVSPEEGSTEPSEPGETECLQNYFGTGEPLIMGVNFEGINCTGIIPPDPNGAVGPNHYFQVVNSHFAIYDRYGTSDVKPIPLWVLWKDWIPAGAVIYDPVVLYDRYAERWVIVAYPQPVAPYRLLFAVSATSDPLGCYHRYAYEFIDFPDYPKIAVWRDGYYLSVTVGLFCADGDALVAALERDSMLTGGGQGGTTSTCLISGE